MVGINEKTNRCDDFIVFTFFFFFWELVHKKVTVVAMDDVATGTFYGTKFLYGVFLKHLFAELGFSAFGIFWIPIIRFTHGKMAAIMFGFYPGKFVDGARNSCIANYGEWVLGVPIIAHLIMYWGGFAELSAAFLTPEVSFYFMLKLQRILLIAVKYAYFPEGDYEHICNYGYYSRRKWSDTLLISYHLHNSAAMHYEQLVSAVSKIDKTESKHIFNSRPKFAKPLASALLEKLSKELQHAADSHYELNPAVTNESVGMQRLFILREQTEQEKSQFLLFPSTAQVLYSLAKSPYFNVKLYIHISGILSFVYMILDFLPMWEICDLFGPFDFYAYITMVIYRTLLFWNVCIFLVCARIHFIRMYSMLHRMVRLLEPDDTDGSCYNTTSELRLNVFDVSTLRAWSQMFTVLKKLGAAFRTRCIFFIGLSIASLVVYSLSFFIPLGLDQRTNQYNMAIIPLLYAVSILGYFSACSTLDVAKVNKKQDSIEPALLRLRLYICMQASNAVLDKPVHSNLSDTYETKEMALLHVTHLQSFLDLISGRVLSESRIAIFGLEITYSSIKLFAARFISLAILVWNIYRYISIT